YSVAELLKALHKVGAGAQLTVLAERAATGAALDDPDSVAELLKALHKVGAGAQLTVLAERAATGAALDHPHHHHAALLEVLQTAGLSEQVTALLARDSAVQAFRVAQVLAVLWKTGVIEQVTAMAERAAADVLLDDPHGIAALLRVLRKAGANGQVTTLLAREPAIHVVLDHPDEVAALLKALRKAGADEQAAVLAERAATGVAITGQPSASQLMNELGKMGAEKQLATLTERLPAAGHFDEFLMSGGNSKRFRFGREPDGTAAAPWTWDDLD
ncbi:hypothetical protein, partial [Streptomyces erythrochromogenes]|uniref:hypothetical protein n=1 Tax=Streptomyces erythrochromogenes TaxID=285574 RepID=UPI0034269A8C